MPTEGRTWKVKNRRQYDSRPMVDAKKSERRKQVLQLNQAGKTNIAIAEELGIDRGTVADDLRFLRKQEETAKLVHDNRFLSRRAKWTKVTIDIRDEAIPYFTKQGIKPSLRTIYYRLRTTQPHLVGNTESDYNNLKTHTKEARLQETDINGVLLYPILPIDCFADETRKLIENYSNYPPTEVEDPDDYIGDAIDVLKDSIVDYDGKGRKGGRWYGQPEYVEVWIEKLADAPTFEKWLEDKDVNTVVNKGYTSIPFLWENIVRLKEKVKEFGAKHVHAQYFGDFDPSGEDMVKSLKKYFKRFGLNPNIIQKVALTQKQIDDYDIPLEPVKDTDTRYDKFETEYGSEGAEMDAFIATDPDGLKKILLDSVDKYFDQKIYDDMEEKYKTSTPLEELIGIHERMLYRVGVAFSAGGWKDEIRDRLKGEVNDDYQEDDEDEDSEDEDDE